jgi:hypothetical protein
MAKALCDWKEKEIEKNRTRFLRIVSKPNYFCSKCGRVAKEEKWLCKSIRITKE